MKCSVVMTTYNGAKYLTRQLDSLRNQSHSPEQVLIFDDGSKDDSVRIVRDYIARYNLSGWQITKNPENFGWKKNFMQGFAKTDCDIIFPCDQDDFWDPDKIKLMEEAMAGNPEISVLACDVKIEYEKGAVLSKHYEGEETKEEGKVVRYPLTTRFFMNPRPGCTYAIRKSFFDSVQDLWQNDFPHDEYLWISAALSGGAWFINRELVTFYRHAANSSDIRFKDIEMQKEQLDYIGRSLEAFKELIKEKRIIPLPAAGDYLKEATKWCAKRKKLMETRNPFRWLSLLPWFKYYNSTKNALSDLYLVIFGKFKRDSLK